MDDAHQLQDHAPPTRPLRVLVTWGSKLGGTEGIARFIGDVLRDDGFEVALEPASHVHDVRGFDAAIIGGALYANRWHEDSRRFVARNIATLRRIPVWLFSSGPLDDSAEHQALPPSGQVAALVERTGALGHVTFGGRLSPDAKGFPASAMAKDHSGDWRNPIQVREWAADVARALPTAHAGVGVDPPARSLPRLVVHGTVAGVLSAATMGGLSSLASPGVATIFQAVLAPTIFVAASVHYFRPTGAREPLTTAIVWTVLAFAADAALAWALGGRPTFSASWTAWIPFLLAYAATWATGFSMSTLPWPKPTPKEGEHADKDGEHAEPALGDAG